MTDTFRALRNQAYRQWATGALVSNIGTWMQRTAQDWMVLTQLTHHNATAVGWVMSLQFGPQLALTPLAGHLADRFERRKLLIYTQSAMALTALLLGTLSLLNLINLYRLYVFALALGIFSALDAPTRQAFVGELTGEDDLPNAIALNSASFHGARLLGPACAGLLMTQLEPGWVFLLNALSYIPLLHALRTLQTRPWTQSSQSDHSLLAGLRYVQQRPELSILLLLIFLVGTFGLNFPIFIATMSVQVFHAGPDVFGLLSSSMAVGSVAGALYSASRIKPSRIGLLLAAILFGVGCISAALAPNLILFAVILAVTGLAAQFFNTSTNSLVQLGTDPGMRGRVMAILLALFLGGTPLGAPLMGSIADHMGARWAMICGGSSGLIVAAIWTIYLLRRHQRSHHVPN